MPIPIALEVLWERFQRNLDMDDYGYLCEIIFNNLSEKTQSDVLTNLMADDEHPRWVMIDLVEDHLEREEMESASDKQVQAEVELGEAIAEARRIK